ncbi:C4-dicarboxylate transporter/malic acid transport protein [Phlegmacium glaucopus]|nr:C4-dicarboxylate transporter/malic acid transport protein [Phlegmacium glaucopus]
MGTGAISNLFFAFPFGTGAQPMIVISLIMFFLNLFLFCSFFIILGLKYICYPDRWSSMLRNPVDSLYAGCFPMGATTIISIAVDVINRRLNYGGKSFLYFIWAIWWLDVFASFACCWVGVHAMITRQEHSLDAMTTMWLLPVVTLIVGSSSGGILCRALQVHSQLHALQTLAVSVFMVTVGLALALMILTVYLLRLIIHGLPRGTTILSVFLPLGPTGQSGYAILLIGENSKKLLPFPSQSDDFLNATSTGAIVEVMCICASFLLWSLATMWILYALLGVYSGLRQSRIAFRLSFWGLVFPNGVYANLSIQLGIIFDSKAFRVFGSFYAVCTLLIWLSVAIRSLLELKNFYLFANTSLNPSPPEKPAQQQD